jgi:hypothetical protein
MRSFAHHMKEWRTPLVIGASVLACLAIWKMIDPTAARVTAAIVLTAAIAGLLSSRQG